MKQSQKQLVIIDAARTIVLIENRMETTTDAVLSIVLIERPTENLSLIGVPKKAFGIPSEKGELPTDRMIERDGPKESARENVLIGSESHQVEIMQ